MKIYLDTGQLSQLEILLNKDPGLAREFLDTWVHYGCELALSKAHIQEIAQLGSETSVVNRINLLEQFPVILYQDASADKVADLEVQAQMLSRVYSIIVDVPPYDKISSNLFSAFSIGNLRKLIMQQRVGFQRNRDFLEDVTGMHTLIRESRSSKTSTYKRGKFDRSKATSKQPDIEQAKRIAKQRAAELFPDGPNMHIFESFFTHLEMCNQKATTEREALLCIYDLEGIHTIDKAPDGDLPIISVVFRIARQRSIPFLERIVPRPFLLSQMQHIDPYDAPGISLRLAVERGRQRATINTKSNDVIDADHIMCAPYVDLMFVDKRTFEFCKQEIKSHPGLVSTRGVSRIRRSKSVENILEEIAHAALRNDVTDFNT